MHTYAYVCTYAYHIFICVCVCINIGHDIVACNAECIRVYIGDLRAKQSMSMRMAVLRQVTTRAACEWRRTTGVLNEDVKQMAFENTQPRMYGGR
jgi:hypothetical protein